MIPLTTGFATIPDLGDVTCLLLKEIFVCCVFGEIRKFFLVWPMLKAGEVGLRLELTKTGTGLIVILFAVLLLPKDVVAFGLF